MSGALSQRSAGTTEGLDFSNLWASIADQPSNLGIATLSRSLHTVIEKYM